MQNVVSSSDYECSSRKECSINWSSIIGGAFVAATVSLVLLVLGAALGFTFMSPWQGDTSPVEFTVKAAIWLIIMQWISSAFGGYITGRMRKKWDGVDADEIFFRDSARGFLMWALSTLLVASFLICATVGVMKAAGGAAMMVAHSNAQNKGEIAFDYYSNGLLRSDRANANTADTRAEIAGILMTVSQAEGVSAEDKAYLSHLVAVRTGTSESDANTRVEKTLAQIDQAKSSLKDLADKARKSAMYFSFFTFLALLIGAGIASIASILGGKDRDEPCTKKTGAGCFSSK